jgi:hypothetical protein
LEQQEQEEQQGRLAEQEQAVQQGRLADLELEE